MLFGRKIKSNAVAKSEKKDWPWQKHQRRLADYLQSRSERLPARTKKILLLVFFLTVGGYCSYLVVDGFTSNPSTTTLGIPTQRPSVPSYLDSLAPPDDLWNARDSILLRNPVPIDGRRQRR